VLWKVSARAEVILIIRVRFCGHYKISTLWGTFVSTELYKTVLARSWESIEHLIGRRPYLATTASGTSSCLCLTIIASCLRSFFGISIFWHSGLHWIDSVRLTRRRSSTPRNDASASNPFWACAYKILHLLSINSHRTPHAADATSERHNFDIHSSFFTADMRRYIELILIPLIDIYITWLLLWWSYLWKLVLRNVFWVWIGRIKNLAASWFVISCFNTWRISSRLRPWHR